MRAHARGTIALLVAAALPVQAAAPRIDLVTVGVRDLAAAVSTIEALGGVRPALGGTHPTRGTHNALLSLGDGTYLEILAARRAPEPTAAPELRELGGPRLLWWGLASDDAAGTATALAGRGFATTSPVPGSRRTPEGRPLAWRTFTLAPALRGGPFFIQWSRDSAHPSATAPGGCRLLSLQVDTPDAPALRRLMPEPPTALRLQAADTSRMRLKIGCPRGQLEFASA